MATVNKDFKVKYGLQVAEGAVFGGPVSVTGAPTAPTHLANKAYVDALGGSVPVASTPPSDPINGQLWFDEVLQRVNVHYNGVWMTIATISDTQNIPQHIHDTSIDGNGLIVTIFTDAGTLYSPQSMPLDGGSADTTSWNQLLDGGLVVDNYN
jgi:hypothetical protein